MKRGSFITSILLVIAMLVTLAACGGSTTGDNNPSASTVTASTDSSAAANTPEAKKVSGKITFTAINGGDPEVKAFNEIIENYQKQSDVTVKLEELPSSNDYENIIKTRFATNDPPDIFYFWSGSNQYTNMQADTNLFDVTNEAFVNDLTEAVKSYQTVDGKIYGVPWGTYNALGVFYNKDVFTKLGLSLPNNYQEFLDICKKVKDAGITPVFEAAGTVWPTQIYTLCGFQSTIIPSIGGDEGLNKIINNQIKLKDIPAVKEVFTQYYELNKLGYMNKDVASATYDMQEEAISNGTAAMVIQGDWMLPDLESKFQKADSLGYFPLPSASDKGIASLYPPKQLFISKAGKNVDAALDFMRYMTKTENLNIWYANNAGIPVYKSATATQFAPQKDILNYINNNQGTIQIQLRTKASFVDFDKICQELILSGNVDKAVTMLNDKYLKDGKDKQIAEFMQ